MSRDNLLAIGFISLFAVIFSQVAIAQYQWQRHPGPVFSTESLLGWDSHQVTHQSVVYLNSTYHMWYMGWADYFTGANQSIGYAISTDGIKWFRYADNPVMDGDVANWTGGSLRIPSVSWIDNHFVMVFGTQGAGPDNLHSHFGFASSTDGTEWEVDPNPILSVGSSDEWDSEGLHQCSPIIVFDGLYWFWYSASGSIGRAIGAAISTDMNSWTKHSSNPLLFAGTPGEWDAGEIAFPQVILRNGLLEMWYSGRQVTNGSGRIGMAFSNDGIHWTKSQYNPVFETGDAGQWDDQIVLCPRVVYNREEIYLWYSAQGNKDPWDYNWNIGLAVSPVPENMMPDEQSETIPTSTNLEEPKLK